MGIKQRGRQSWRNSAKCVGTDLYLWEVAGRAPDTVDVSMVIGYCANCPVVRQCANDALLSGDTGVIRAGIPIPAPGAGARNGRQKAKTALQLVSFTGNVEQARTALA